MAKVLLIDDDPRIFKLVSPALRPLECELRTTLTGEEGFELARTGWPDVLLLDILLPRISGLELYKQIREIDAKLPVIFITSLASSGTAIEALVLGAFDYIVKPLNLEILREKVEKAIKLRQLHEPVLLPDSGNSSLSGDELVGKSPEMLRVYKDIGRVAAQNVSVLIRGESGTGKELVARALYQYSDRSEGPFHAVNCAAIPEQLLESEFFGHVRGAFTDALTNRVGKFEQCHQGTLFLDEVGDMSPSLQSKVLRALQEKEIQRVGDTKVIKTDVRIIAATHRDLELMPDHQFRRDLYYRLNGFTIDLPPLRARGEDLSLLVDHFLKRYNQELDKEIKGLCAEAYGILQRYQWPGNVRELQSVLKQAMLKSVGPILVADCFQDERRLSRQRTVETSPEDPLSGLHQFINERLNDGSTNLHAETIEFIERVLLQRVLTETKGNQSRASEILGIARGSLRSRIRSLRIKIDQVVFDEQNMDEQ